MIITVTPNPAYDVTYELPGLVVGEVHRVTKVHQRTGGKGINATRVLVTFGESTAALALGDKAFADAAHAEGLNLLEVVEELAGVRRTLVVHSADGTTTSLWEPGYPASASAGARLEQRVTARLAEATGLLVCGSVPPGVTADLPARLAARAASVGVPVVVDVDDEALRHAAKTPGVVLMPNTDELSRLTGADCGELTGIVAAAQACVDDGVAGVVATRGADGMAAVTSGGGWLARLDQPLTGNSTGAGDAAAAAVIRGLAGDVGWPDLLRDAVAMSAAAVMAPVAGHVDLDIYEALRDRVSVSTVPLPWHAA